MRNKNYVYLINARPVLVGILQSPYDGLVLPIADDGASDGDVALVHCERDEKELKLEFENFTLDV